MSLPKKYVIINKMDMGFPHTPIFTITEDVIMRLKLEDLTLEQKLGMLYCARTFRDSDLELP